MKNKKKLKDGDGLEWSTNSGGVVTYKEDSASFEEPEPPALSGDN